MCWVQSLVPQPQPEALGPTLRAALAEALGPALHLCPRVWAGCMNFQDSNCAAWGVKKARQAAKPALSLRRRVTLRLLLLSEPRFPHLQHGHDARYSSDVSFFTVQLSSPSSSPPPTLSLK